jgi:hypothetical protein
LIVSAVQYGKYTALSALSLEQWVDEHTAECYLLLPPASNLHTRACSVAGVQPRHVSEY